VSFLWLLRKETRELIASRAWWVLLLAMGPLVGVTFISAVVGLLTGHLFLLGRGSLIIHGIWARIVSAFILMFGAFLAWRIKRKVPSSVK